MDTTEKQLIWSSKIMFTLTSTYHICQFRNYFIPLWIAMNIRLSIQSFLCGALVIKSLIDVFILYYNFCYLFQFCWFSGTYKTIENYQKVWVCINKRMIIGHRSNKYYDYFLWCPIKFQFFFIYNTKQVSCIFW